MKTSHFLLLLALNVGWSTLPTLATRLEGHLNPLEFIFLRYAFAGLGVLALWRWLPGEMPRGRDFWRTVLLGIVVFCAGHYLQVAGMQRSQASDASILLALDPLVSTLGAAWFLHEHVPMRRWLGFALAIAGVVGMSCWGRDLPLPGLVANLMVVASFVTEAAWSVTGKPLIVRWGIPKVTGLALLAGTIVNGALLVPDWGAHERALRALPWEGWASLAVLGWVLTAFGYSAWFIVIREAPVSVASMTIYLQPIVGTLVALGFTGDRLHAGHVVGSALIVGGLVVGLWHVRERTKAG